MREKPGCLGETNLLLEIKDLSTGYEDLPVLLGVSIVICAGETVALLGPNGHGKTTLLRTISGLHRSWSGEIRFLGEDISQWPPHLIAAQGLVHVPQGDLLFSDMSIMENLLTAAYLPDAWRERRKRIEIVWRIFPQLRERRGELTRNLSGGERRMVAIGRGLMANAKLMMLDEPSLGLAPVAIDSLYEALGQLKEMGLPILVVEEAPERIGRIADRVYLMDAGAVVREGSVSDILEDRALLETYLG